MEWTLEVIPVPVTDLDRAKEFYAERCGFTVDVDTQISEGVRIIQLTPPGSRCSIALMQGMPPIPGRTAMAPGALQGLQLCVVDIEAAHAELVRRGVDVSPVQHLGADGWAEGRGGVWNSFMLFQDPDGNGWTVQEAPSPLSER
ncbi:VOC family protein [Streptomyces olivaceiscleroticus]|uniref:VOC family protein n=1 Tax=Streptomyces olivaceiscleroticus TaxID=68245 RepID=A0ABN1A5F4_9ACTN